MRWQQILGATPHEPLTAEQVAAIRRAAIAAATLAAARPSTRQAPAMVITGALLSAVTAAVFVAASSAVHPGTPAVTAAPAPAAVKQLQFATPGGTRIIWHFNPAFALPEPLR